MSLDHFPKGPDIVVYRPQAIAEEKALALSFGPYASHLTRQLIAIDDFSVQAAELAVQTAHTKAASKFSAYLSGERGPAESGAHVSGIVIGSVQSGKTISFSAVAAHAFDLGASAVVVISGSDSALRDQTVDRLREYFGDVADVVETLGNETADQLSREALIGRVLDGRRKSVLVAMKEDQHLVELQKILAAVSQRLSEFSPPKVVIVDDEGDQGSLNGMARLTKQGIRRATRIHSLITEVCQSKCVAAYLAYTATAFANALTDQETAVFPTGFVSVLEPGEGYLGLSDLFLGSTYFRQIEEFEAGVKDLAVEALENAVDHFLLVSEAKSRMKNGHSYQGLPELPAGCLVMGVNAGQKNIAHDDAIGIIRRRLEAWASGKVFGGWLSAAAEKILREQEDLAELARSYENWSADRALALLANIVKLNQDGDSKMRSFKSAPDRIIVGGLLLGRGFTLPRMISYVLLPTQDSAAMDSLQQKARFLGYRKNYAPWMRIWMDVQARESYAKLARAEQSFRYQARVLEENNLGLDSLEKFIVLAGNRKPTAPGKISVGKKFSSAWWTSTVGCLSTPQFVNEIAERVLASGSKGMRGAYYLEVSSGEARKLVDAFVDSAPGDAARLRGGLELSLGPKRDPDVDARVTLYVMSGWMTGRQRKRDVFDGVEQLFMGPGGSNEPSEREIYSRETAVTIQLHRLKTSGQEELGVGMAIRPTDKVAPNRSLWILDEV